MSLPAADLSLADIARTLDAVAAEAGEIALRWFRPGEKTTAHTEYKHGGSPVTEADFAVDAFLAQRLQALFPGAAWLSEETADSGARHSADTVQGRARARDGRRSPHTFACDALRHGGAGRARGRAVVQGFA